MANLSNPYSRGSIYRSPQGGYDSAAVAQGFGNIAHMFAPPSAQDLDAYARAGLTNQQRQQYDWLFNNSNDPTASARSSLIGVQGYGSTPAGFAATDATNRYGIDQKTAADRYGVDQKSATDIAVGKGNNTASAIGTLYSPLSQGQTRPEVPADVASLVGLPGDVPAVSGAPKPMTTDEWQAGQNQRLQQTGSLTDQMLLDAIAGKESPVKVMGPNGPIFVSPGAAVRTGATPAQDIPTSVQEYDFGQTDPKYNTWLTDQKKAGASSTQVGPDGKLGQVPPGYMVIQDPSAPNGTRMVAVAGGPADKGAITQGGADNKADVAVTAAGRGSAAREKSFGGLVGAALGYLPTSNNAEVNRQTEALKGLASIEGINQMRAASPTGGAVGNASDKDMALLSASVGALDPLSPHYQRDVKDYLLNLLRVTYNGKPGLGDVVYQNLYGAPPDGSDTPLSTPQMPVSQAVALGLQQIGGAPAAPAAPAAPGGTTPPAAPAEQPIPTVASPDEAMKLPPGTKFMDPQGNLRVRP